LCAGSHDPTGDGARVPSNNEPAAPARSTSTSSTLSPPASIDPITDTAFAPLFATLSQAQSPVDQPGQVQPLSQHRGRQQPGVRHQIRLVEAHRHSAQIVLCSHSAGALLSGRL